MESLMGWKKGKWPALIVWIPIALLALLVGGTLLLILGDLKPEQEAVPHS